MSLNPPKGFTLTITYVDSTNHYTTLVVLHRETTQWLKVGSDDETTINMNRWTWEVTNDDDDNGGIRFFR